jgi:hypothetical protein
MKQHLISHPPTSKSPQPGIFLKVALACIAVALMGAGCKSVSGPGSASFASVIIKNQPGELVAKTTAQVFIAHGYRGGMTAAGEMTFEKEASRSTTFAREGLVETYYGAQTINRVRVELIELSEGVIRVQCKAYMVTGGSDAFFQDEVPVSNIRSGPYQSILNDVKSKLKKS